MPTDERLYNDPKVTIDYDTVPLPQTMEELDAWPAKVREAFPKGVLVADLCVDTWDSIGIEYARLKTAEELQEEAIHDEWFEVSERKELARLKEKYEGVANV